MAVRATFRDLAESQARHVRARIAAIELRVVEDVVELGAELDVVALLDLIILKGSAPTREFDLSVARKLPFSHGKEYREDDIWKTFTTFIRAVIPVAEKNKVRIGLHPDDPPVDSLGGVARIFRNVEGYERAFKIADSENFGMCLCVGTWGEGGKMMGKDPVEAIRYFGPKGKIWKIHFRNVTSPRPKFREAFIDDGYMDMYAIMKALKEVNFDGIIIPDHVPGGGGPNVNNSYTLGYIKALRDRVNKEARG